MRIRRAKTHVRPSMCFPFTHRYRVVDMVPGTKTHRDSLGEMVTSQITAVLYQCQRCGLLKSDGLLGRFRFDRVLSAQESRELSRLVKM